MKPIGLLIALLLAGSADELAPTAVSALKLSVPAAWNKKNDEGTMHYAAPSGEAFFDLDVGAVQSAGMTGEVCLGKILDSLGPTLGTDGWQRLSIGAQPAAVKTHVDTDPAGKAFITNTYVGCNGKTTWAVSFHMVSAKKDRFGPLADKIVQGIEYAR